MSILLQIIAILGLIAVGYVVDTISNDAFKERCHRLLYQPQRQMQEVRFSGFLDRFFGTGIFTLRSFFATITVVLGAYVTLFIGTFLFSPGGREELEKLIAAISTPQILVLLGLFLTTCIGDYLSYAQTRLFVRQAESSSGFGQSAIFVASDFVISLILFTVFFALAYTLSVSIYANTTETTISRSVSDYSPALVDELVPMPDIPITDDELNLLAHDDENAATILASRVARTVYTKDTTYEASIETNSAFHFFFLKGKISPEYADAKKPWDAPTYVRSNWKPKCASVEGSTDLFSPFTEIVHSSGAQAGFLNRAIYNSAWLELTRDERAQYENLDQLLQFYQSSNRFISAQLKEDEGGACLPYTEISIEFEASDLAGEISFSQAFNSSLYKSINYGAQSSAYQFRYYTMPELSQNFYGDLSNALTFGYADTSSEEFNFKYFLVLSLVSPSVTKDWPKVYVPYSTPALVSLVPSFGFVLFLALKWTRLYILGSSRVLASFARNFEYTRFPITVAAVFISLALSLLAFLLNIL